MVVDNARSLCICVLICRLVNEGVYWLEIFKGHFIQMGNIDQSWYSLEPLKNWHR